jgi:hypothetical protein
MTKRYRQEGVSPGVTTPDDLPCITDEERAVIAQELKRLGIQEGEVCSFLHQAALSLAFVHGLSSTVEANPGVTETLEQVTRAEGIIEAFRALMTEKLPPALSGLPSCFGTQEQIALQCDSAMSRLNTLRSYGESGGGIGGRDAKEHRTELFDQLRRGVCAHGGNISEGYQEQAFGTIFSIYLRRLEGTLPKNFINTTRARWKDEGREAALCDEQRGHPAAAKRRLLAAHRLELLKELGALRTRRARLGTRLNSIRRTPTQYLPEIFPEREQ